MSFRNLKYKLPFIAIALFQQYHAFAQDRSIHGIVRNDINQTLPFANIRLVDEQSTTIKFAIADKNGAFIITIPSAGNNRPSWLVAAYIGYKNQSKPIDLNSKTIDFVLEPDSVMLSEIVIKNRPALERLGDTLRYQVMSFAKPEDRSIGDVLRRMPGIDIAGDGTIYYNGKKIENLYIQGDDLMDGRYGLASKVVRKEDIQSVDVIRNHQPIKVLQNKVLTDNTAINLVLKNENSIKISTNASIGVGLPGVYDVSVTPILLNKNVKMLNTIAFNNSGNDYTNDFRQLGIANFLPDIGSRQTEFSLSQGIPSPPDLPLATYYFNHSGLINLNNIYNTKSGIQVKLNVQGFIDRNSLIYEEKTFYYTGSDTILYNQRQAVTNKPFIFNTSLNVMVNKDKYFFNDNVKINFSKDNDYSTISFNADSFAQTLRKTGKGVSNDLNWIPQLSGRGIGEFRWLLSYKTDDQALDIGKGYDSQIPGQEGYYDNVIQHYSLPTLFSNAYFGYKIPGTILMQQYKVGYINETQTLGSRLVFVENQQTTAYQYDDGNDLKWNRQNYYASADYQLKYNKFQTDLTLPLAYQYIHYSEKDYTLNVEQGNLIFNPEVELRYNLSLEQRLTAKYRLNNTFGDVTNVYRGAILQNYLTLESNDLDLQEKNLSSSGLSYDFEKSIILLFINAAVYYDRTEANTILSSQITDNIEKTVALPYENLQTNLRFNWNFSKYVFWLKSTFSFKAQVNRLSFQEIINNQLVPFHSNSLTFSGSFTKNLLKTFMITYLPVSIWSRSKLDQSNAQSENVSYDTFRLDQRLTISYNNNKLLHLEADARHSFSQQADNGNVQYFFCDLKARQTLKKSRIDISLEATNLFNVKNYALYSIYTNQLIINHYDIRGRMVMLKVNCYF